MNLFRLVGIRYGTKQATDWNSSRKWRNHQQGGVVWGLIIENSGWNVNQLEDSWWRVDEMPDSDQNYDIQYGQHSNMVWWFCWRRTERYLKPVIGTRRILWSTRQENHGNSCCHCFMCRIAAHYHRLHFGVC